MLAHRRGGYRVVLGVAAVLAFLVRGYGVGTLTEPWNPYLPLLWWVVLLLAVWSVVCGDFVVLPVAVFAASFCAQTHLPYLGLSLGLGALAAVAAVVTAWRTPRQSRERKSLLTWGLVALVLGVAVWSPVVVDQMRHDPGNLRSSATTSSTRPINRSDCAPVSVSSCCISTSPSSPTTNATTRAHSSTRPAIPTVRSFPASSCSPCGRECGRRVRLRHRRLCGSTS